MLVLAVMMSESNFKPLIIVAAGFKVKHTDMPNEMKTEVVDIIAGRYLMSVQCRNNRQQIRNSWNPKP